MPHIAIDRFRWVAFLIGPWFRFNKIRSIEPDSFEQSGANSDRITGSVERSYYVAMVCNPNRKGG